MTQHKQSHRDRDNDRELDKLILSYLMMMEGASTPQDRRGGGNSNRLSNNFYKNS